MRFYNWLKSAWRWLNNFLEYGDLVPLLVVVSSFHYMTILAGKDQWPVAIAIGILVDLGHFRTIRAAFRYTGDDRSHLFKRWVIALAMTGISLAYHQRYYNDWWLSAPIPFLIAALAWLQKVDKRNVSQPSQSPSQTSQLKSQPALLPLASEAYDTSGFSELVGYVCSECGYVAKSLAAHNGHKRKHSPLLAKSNGKAHPA